MPNFQTSDYIIIGIIVVAIIVIGVYYINRKTYQKLKETQSLIEQSRMTTSIFVIDKRKEKPEKVKLQKGVLEQIPKWQRFRKMYFVMAKIGPQIFTLTCDKSIYDAIPVKKTIKIDLAGIYIVEIKGMKETKNKSLFEKAKDTVFNANKNKS